MTMPLIFPQMKVSFLFVFSLRFFIFRMFLEVLAILDLRTLEEYTKGHLQKSCAFPWASREDNMYLLPPKVCDLHFLFNDISVIDLTFTS